MYAVGYFTNWPLAVLFPAHKHKGIYNIKRYNYIVDIIIITAGIIMMQEKQGSVYNNITIIIYKGRSSYKGGIRGVST